METGQIPQCRCIYHYLHWLTISKNLAGVSIEWSNFGLTLLFGETTFQEVKNFLTRYEPTLRNIYCTKITFNPIYQRKNPDLNLVQKNFKAILSKSFQITYLSKTWKNVVSKKPRGSHALTVIWIPQAVDGPVLLGSLESNVGILRFVLEV